MTVRVDETEQAPPAAARTAPAVEGRAADEEKAKSEPRS
jgi:hypothetical protein